MEIPSREMAALETAGNALLTEGVGAGAPNASSSKSRRLTAGAGGGGGAAASRLAGVDRTELARTGVEDLCEETSSSPALYSSNPRRLSLKEDPPPTLRLLPPPDA